MEIPIAIDESLFREEPEVELVAWLVEDGAIVHPGQAIAQVMTAKVVVEVTAPAAGRLRRGRHQGELLTQGMVLGAVEHD